VALTERDIPTLQVAERVRRVADQIETVIIGKRDVVEMALTAFLCGGHVLIEDIPGVGKTTLAKALARALGCVYKRVQFTPDLLPADITGSSIYNQKNSEFEFREGPIFANIVLADEINRATPRTQSSLLECMEERQVTADGITYTLPRPFFVIATENDIEAQGTYPLPEAQMDRFVMRLSIGYPDRADEVRILARQAVTQSPEVLEPTVTPAQVLALQDAVREIYVDDSIRDYIVDIVAATRSHPQTLLGASPRGSLFLLHASQAAAALAGRTYVLPDDVKRLAGPVLAHRLILRPGTRLLSRPAEGIIAEILERVPVPVNL
jgi:MoxR-like ATPase